MKAKRYFIIITWFRTGEHAKTVIDVEERFLEMVMNTLPMCEIESISIEENNKTFKDI